MEVEKSRDGTVKLNFVEGYSSVIIPLGGRKTLVRLGVLWVVVFVLVVGVNLRGI